MDYLKNGLLHDGNTCRLEKVFLKAMKKEELTIGFLGGSVTQGARSSTPKTCYSYLVYEWWVNTFSKTSIQYVNAGIGGTSSQFGCARVQEDLLSKKPDLVILEFSVNDENTPHFLETYEGVLRKILFAPNSPAVLIFHNFYYDNGKSAQDIHYLVGKTYDVPCISLKNTLYPEILSGRIKAEDVAPDDLHPNDIGHRILAEQLTSYLESMISAFEKRPLSSQEANLLEVKYIEFLRTRRPISRNRYENSVRYNNKIALPKLVGFVKDEREQETIRDIFKNGWEGKEKGASAVFHVFASCIAIQYRKTIKQPSPIAVCILDKDEEHPIILDSNFKEDWGDSLHLETVMETLEAKEHTVEIRITHVDDNLGSPFYLNAVIGSI